MTGAITWLPPGADVAGAVDSLMVTDALGVDVLQPATNSADMTKTDVSFIF